MRPKTIDAIVAETNSTEDEVLGIVERLIALDGPERVIFGEEDGVIILTGGAAEAIVLQLKG
jgi:hypothetical protein